MWVARRNELRSYVNVRRPLPGSSSPSLPCLWTRPSLTSNRSAKSAPTTSSSAQYAASSPSFSISMSSRHEHGAERVGGRGGEALRGRAVEREAQLRHEPGVTEEQSLRVIGIDLAGSGRDAERRALDECDDALGAADGRARARRPRLRHCGSR